MMTDHEKALFCGMAALIFPAFAPIHLMSGQVVAVVGFVIFGVAAIVLEERDHRRK